ncbi:MAG: hypothetical protein DRI90_01165 [Deltaproteobacteria bacterium]|nr:MAG: hypothetical protein DRI90_01165 [Deltaproteobacteria bacterium]
MDHHGPQMRVPASGRHRYQPCYCEENVWWLCQHQSFADLERWVVFISNPARQCILLEQRASPASRAVIWDYHVILLACGEAQLEVWDLDTQLGVPVPLVSYLAQTFPPLPPGGAAFMPLFRVVPVGDFLTTFATDRSHMLAPDGSWLAPPPPWTAPAADGQEANLMRFVDMGDDVAGDVVDLAGLLRRFAGAEAVGRRR